MGHRLTVAAVPRLGYVGQLMPLQVSVKNNTALVQVGSVDMLRLVPVLL